MARQRVGVAQAYLALYNAAQAVAWAYCLTLLAQGLAAKEDYIKLAQRVAVPVGWAQGASVLEVVHAAIGLVPSSPLSVLQQWAGRSNVLFLVMGHALTAVQAPRDNALRSWASVCVTVGGLWGTPRFSIGRHLGLLTMAAAQQAPLAAVVMLGAWSLAEVVRYPWYALTTLNACPAVLTWLRYTVFIPLYPAGVVAEVALMLTALPRLALTHAYSIALPNKANMAFSYNGFLQVVLAAYPFLWWQLYSGLLRTRAKRLRSAAGSTGGKAKAE